MQEIKCPKCGEVFQVDESGYAALVRQVRDKEFEKELSERKAQYLSEKENAVLLAQTQTRQELAEEISRLQAKRAAAESARQLAEADARSRQEKLLSRKLRTRISPWRFPKQLPRKKSRSTKWTGRFMT